MNRVFLSGKIGKTPELAYTPKGRKIAMFPLVVDGELTIDVIGAADFLSAGHDNAAGSSVLVAGEIVTAKLKSRDVLRVNASKILWMEE